MFGERCAGIVFHDQLSLDHEMGKRFRLVVAGAEQEVRCTTVRGARTPHHLLVHLGALAGPLH